eukprot:CAMPEP_0180485934 /NCGR_PEP_ID=MMETSP1036_2-20121128/36735_1 /TAXON_ID=632150 /ORGANISM="Azadinium spinosum, Strain 3D9" /LENGTH=219 /DNA_ID=CAMNT_0022493871 /DNA_START=233 /DNA_END=893 /DNA_ORIENTATION=-
MSAALEADTADETIRAPRRSTFCMTRASCVGRVGVPLHPSSASMNMTVSVGGLPPGNISKNRAPGLFASLCDSELYIWSANLCAFVVTPSPKRLMKSPPKALRPHAETADIDLLPQRTFLHESLRQISCSPASRRQSNLLDLHEDPKKGEWSSRKAHPLRPEPPDHKRHAEHLRQKWESTLEYSAQTNQQFLAVPTPAYHRQLASDECPLFWPRFRGTP